MPFSIDFSRFYERLIANSPLPLIGSGSQTSQMIEPTAVRHSRTARCSYLENGEFFDLPSPLIFEELIIGEKTNSFHLVKHWIMTAVDLIPE